MQDSAAIAQPQLVLAGLAIAHCVLSHLFDNFGGSCRMTAGGASPAALGFLTVVEDEQQGLVGGYLLLNPLGRPVEFHCTAPVKPNRAQQILYGPTLRPYL